MAARRRWGAASPGTSIRLGLVVALTITAGLAVLPLVLLAVLSLSRNWYWPQLLPAEWSLRSWRYVISADGGVGTAVLTSAFIAAAVALVAVMVSTPAARALALQQFRGKRLVLFGLLLPALAPPLAAAMGVHAAFVRLGLADTYTGVALVHLIPAVPYATLMLTGSFANFDVQLEAQARTLGASPRQVWTQVTLPMMAPGLAMAAVFAFLISWSQYLLTLIIGGGRIVTLPVLLVGFQRGGDEAVSAALALVFITPTLALFAWASRSLKDL
jgi:putative spermidine/putrescine transport system permease protein